MNVVEMDSLHSTQTWEDYAIDGALKIESFFWSKYAEIRRDYFSNADQVIANVAKAVLGIAVGYLIFPCAGYLFSKIIHVMVGLKFNMSGQQDALSLLDYLSPGPASLFRFIKQIALTSLLATIVIFGPILEEILFRAGLHSILKDTMKNPDSLLNRGIRIVENGVVFGLAHFSPFQGWMNVPIVCTTGALGCAFALLREATGDIIAPSTAHMTYNGIAVSPYFLRV